MYKDYVEVYCDNDLYFSGDIEDFLEQENYDEELEFVLNNLSEENPYAKYLTMNGDLLEIEYSKVFESEDE